MTYENLQKKRFIEPFKRQLDFLKMKGDLS